MSKSLTRFSSLALGLLLTGAIASGQICSEWLWSNPLPQGNRLNGVAYGGGAFVAVGSSGVILTSLDGSAWTPRFPDTRADLFDVAWNGKLFVAVGSGGAAFTSPDGVFWAGQPTGSAATLSRLAWNGTLLTAVGGSGTILTSPDGSAWTARSSGSDQTLRDIAWSGSRFVAVGDLGTILASPDGASWARSPFDTRDMLSSVAWNGSEFVVSSAGFLTSFGPSRRGRHELDERLPGTRRPDAAPRLDGVRVSRRGRVRERLLEPRWPALDKRPRPDGLRPAGSRFGWKDRRGCRCQGDDPHDRRTAPPGPTEPSATAIPWGTWRGTGRNTSRWAASERSSRVPTRPRGRARRASSTAGSWEWPRTGGNGSRSASRTRSFRAADGVAWARRTPVKSAVLHDVLWDGARFVAVGGDGAVLTSADGETWTEQAPT